MYLYILVLFLLATCFVLIQAKRMISISLALASLSAITASLLYLGGTSTAAVIELSVGAGLVAVLFTLANSLVPERSDTLGIALPRPLVIFLIVLALGILFVNRFTLPMMVISDNAVPISLWEERGADLLILMALMFSAVLTISALLVEVPEQRSAYEQQ